MDRFDAMRVFIRIVERRSFTNAADDLGLPRSSVTDAVKGLRKRGQSDFCHLRIGCDGHMAETAANTGRPHGIRMPISREPRSPQFVSRFLDEVRYLSGV